MWFLEHESLFGGKRVWLRPGSQQLFGRTKSSTEGKIWKIDNKAVSRQHVTIKVLEVHPEAGTKLHTRSQIQITDLSCRQGTTIDEKKHLKSKKNDDGSIDYEKAILEGTEHTVRLAQGYAPFKIVWRPVVFTYASKENRETKSRRAQLHALDIKTTMEFVFGKTTHVVTQKRNLPRVLSGLVAGKHIITEEFLDAVVNAAITGTDSEGGYVPSQLEEDFDNRWPKEEEYVPPTATEPVPRPQEMLKPDSSRSEIFSNLIFIFLDQNQFDSLQQPISGGGGKALLFNLIPCETTVREYVQYAQNVAGKKSSNHGSDSSLPVVTVRLPLTPDDTDGWAATFMNDVDKALNQRSIFQNEFLDIIITKNRTALQQPPNSLSEVASSAPEFASASHSVEEQMPASMTSLQAPEPTIPTNELAKPSSRKRTHRPKTTSRFTGFDDYEPPTKVRKTEDTQTEVVQEPVPQFHRTTTQATGGQYATAPTTQPQAGTRTPTGFASPLSAHEIVEKEEQMDSLFPAAAEVKRRRAATGVPSASVEFDTNTLVTHPKRRGVEALENLQRARKKAGRETNIREQSRLRIKEEEDRRKADEESLREQLEGIDIEQMKNLAVIEEMDVLPRAQRSNGDNPLSPADARVQAKDDRWDPAWNGRKNFKRFRRRGAEQGVALHKVIVALEEVPKQKGFGDSAFFLEDVEPRATAMAKSRRKVAESGDESGSETGFKGRKSRAQSQKHTQEQQPEIINVEDSGPDDEEVVEIRTQKSSGRTQRVIETQVSEAGGKKRVGGAVSGAPPSKRGRVSRRDEDSDEEETGFRFKRR